MDIDDAVLCLLSFAGLAFLFLPGLASPDKEDRQAAIGCGCGAVIGLTVYYALLVLAASGFALPFWAALVIAFAATLSLFGALMLLSLVYSLVNGFFAWAYRRLRCMICGVQEPVAQDRTGDSPPASLPANESQHPAA